MVLSEFKDLERKLDRLVKEPENPQLYHEIGVMLYEAGDFQNAEMYLHRAYELTPLDKDILYNYASLFYFQSEFLKDIPLYQACLQLEPDNQDIIEKVADSYYQTGEYESAAKYMDYLQNPGKAGPLHER